LTLAAVALILVVRKTDAVLHPQLWAEDGVVFFRQALLQGVSSIFVPYAGYLHLTQRLVALPASLLPCQIVPLVYTSAAGLILLWACSRLLSPRFNVPYPPLFALALVLMPQSRGECFLTLVNLQWVLAPLLVVLAVQTAPASRRDRWGDWLLTGLLGLTGPFVILALPLFVVRSLRERSRYAHVLTAIALGGSAVQAIYIAFNPPVLEPAVHAPGLWMEVLGRRLFGSLFLPESLTVMIPPVMLAGLSAAVPVLVVFLARGERERLRLVLSFQLFAAAMLVAVIYQMRAEPASLLPFETYERYFLNVYVMTAWSLIVALKTAQVRRWIGGLLLLMLLGVTLSGLRWSPFTDYDWAARCPAIGGPAPVRIPINPPGWQIELPPHADVRPGTPSAARD
jgi:hypothetical protein